MPHRLRAGGRDQKSQRASHQVDAAGDEVVGVSQAQAAGGPRLAVEANHGPAGGTDSGKGSLQPTKAKVVKKSTKMLVFSFFIHIILEKVYL